MPLGLVAVVLALLALEAWARNHGGSLDPTDPINFNTFVLANDSNRPVYVHLCDDSACRKLDGHFGWVRVEPAHSDSEQIGWGMGRVVYAVSVRAGGAGGYLCLTVDDSRRVRSPTHVHLSQAAPCK